MRQGLEKHTVVVQSATACPAALAAAAAAPAPAQWPGAKIGPLLACLSLGLILNFVVPCPAGITQQGWTLLSIFVSTIAGLVLEPLPVGAWAFLAATACIVTKTLTFTQTFSAFTNDVIWLIVVSFFFAKGFEKTGLGERVAQMFVVFFGKSTLGLAYGLSLAEALIAPAMPSTTARAGGIFMPIMNSLSLSAGSKPNDESRKKLGAFLVNTQFQGSVNSSALFLTAAAQNLLCLKIATEMGVIIPNAWTTWFAAAAVPAVSCLLLTPLIMYRIFSPEIKETPEAPALAAKRLESMGPMGRDEKIMLATMGAAVCLWVCGDAVGISAVATAMLGLSCLLMTGVLTWRECLTHVSAWDTLFWFAVLVGIAGQLNTLGVISFGANLVSNALVAANLSSTQSFVLLNAGYFVSHYLFASQTAHVGALYGAFLAMMLSTGVPGVLAALSLGAMSNLFGSLTHYGSGQGAVYYGAGYLDLKEVFKYGAIMGTMNFVLWLFIGSFWWRAIGLV